MDPRRVRAAAGRGGEPGGRATDGVLHVVMPTDRGGSIDVICPHCRQFPKPPWAFNTTGPSLRHDPEAAWRPAASAKEVRHLLHRTIGHVRRGLLLHLLARRPGHPAALFAVRLADRLLHQRHLPTLSPRRQPRGRVVPGLPRVGSDPVGPLAVPRLPKLAARAPDRRGVPHLLGRSYPWAPIASAGCAASRPP